MLFWDSQLSALALRITQLEEQQIRLQLLLERIDQRLSMLGDEVSLQVRESVLAALTQLGETTSLPISSAVSQHISEATPCLADDSLSSIASSEVPLEESDMQ